MGNCFGFIRDVSSYPPETYERILNTFCWRFGQIKYLPKHINIDTLYDWDGFPLIRLDEEFIHKCIQKYNIKKYNYSVTKHQAEFKIKFHIPFKKPSININSVVPYNENEMACGDLGFSYL